MSIVCRESEEWYSTHDFQILFWGSASQTAFCGKPSPARWGLSVTTGLNKAHGTSLIFLYLELSHMATFNYKRDWDRKFWCVSWGEWLFWKTVVCVTDDMAQICSFTTLCVWQAQGLSTGRLYCDVLKQRDGLVFDDSQCGALSQCLQQTLWSLSYGTREDLGKIAENLII